MHASDEQNGEEEEKKKKVRRGEKKNASPIVMCVHPPNSLAAVLSNNRADLSNAVAWVVAVAVRLVRAGAVAVIRFAVTSMCCVLRASAAARRCYTALLFAQRKSPVVVL